jgi:hypothetical protein
VQQVQQVKQAEMVVLDYNLVLLGQWHSMQVAELVVHITLPLV